MSDNKITVGIMHIYEAPAGQIADAGIRELLALIKAQAIKSDSIWSALNPNNNYTVLPSLPEAWVWMWIVQHGDYTGTLPKRIAKFYFKSYGIKCPPSFLEKLGNIARAHSATTLRYSFKFTQDFDWEAGDFGDYGSCYFDDHSGAREMLADNGAYAICFYADDKGFARAWLVEIEASLYILYNGYGLDLISIARVFAGFLGLSSKKIQLVNNGRANGLLWINGERGYIVGATDRIESIDYHDFEWGDLSACYDCGRSLSDDEIYCSSCFYESFSDCEYCGRTLWIEDMSYIEGDGHVCGRCFDRHYFNCDHCGDTHALSERHMLDDRGFCADCYERELEERANEESENESEDNGGDPS